MATGNSGYVDFTASQQGGSQVMRVYWSETYDVGTWSSTVSITKVEFSTTAYVGYEYKAAFEITVNGSTAVSISESDGWKVASGGTTLTEVKKNNNSLTGSVSGIAHNADGSKTVNIAIKNTNWSYPGFWTSYSYYDYADLNNPVLITVGVPIKFTNNDSKSIQLYTIAAASTISAPSGQFGVSHTITINRQFDTATHTLVATCLGQTQTIMTKAATYPTKSWTPPASWMDYIPNATSAACTITCTTYSGNTAVGTSSISVTLSVTGVNPAPTLATAEPSGQTHVSKYGHMVQGKSRVQVTVTPGTKRSATVASVSVTANGATTAVSGTPYVMTTSALKNSGSNTITATVRDSRGLSGSGTATIAGVLAYSAPSLTISVHRCDNDLTANDDGTYMKITYSATITALNNANAKTIAYRTKMSGGAWTNWTSSTLGSYTASGDLGAIDISAGIANGASYDVECKVTDDFGTVARSTSLSTMPVTIDLNEYGDGIAFGKSSTMRNTFDIGSWGAIGRVLGLGVARAQISSNGDLNDYTEPGVYGIATDGIAATLANSPSTDGGQLVVWNANATSSDTSAVVQERRDYKGNSWRRYATYSGGVWTFTAWVGFGTKAVLGLSGIADTEYKNCAGSASLSFSLAAGEAGMVITSGAHNSQKQLFVYQCNSSGTVSQVSFRTASYATASVSTNTLTVANGYTGYLYACKIRFV